jgi:tetratricopeptide (TPR) repeat protein
MRIKTAALVLSIIILGVYYPVTFAGVNSLDDFRMLDELPHSGALDIWTLFNPIHSVGYFRPLIILSYYIDASVLNLTPEAMHFENVLIHLLNSLLVLVVGLKVFKELSRRVELAFVAACLFAMHPLNVEAIAWISGRTDPLAALFVLLALACVYRCIESAGILWLWGASILCLAGALAKETALFCLPALFGLACVNNIELRKMLAERRWRKMIWSVSRLAFPFIFSGSLYLSLRLTTLRLVTNRIASSATGVATAGENNVHSLWHLVQKLLITYGFYIKKLFLPLPLNFAITRINDNYLLLGIAVFVFVFVACWLRGIRSVTVQMSLATLIVMASAFVISRVGIAWTPYAERYLYIPAVFFVLGFVEFGRLLSNRYLTKSVTTIVVFCLLGGAAVVTTQRTLVWQDNLSLYQDTLKKTPDFGCISNELAIALNAHNKQDEAMRQIELGKKASNQGDMVLLSVNKASILGEQKRYEDAYKELARTYRNGNLASAHIEVIKSYIHLMERERVNSKDQVRSRVLLNKLADLHELYYRRSGDIDHLYRTAQLLLASGDRKRAHKMFSEVAEHAPNDSMFKGFAHKMSDKTR